MPKQPPAALHPRRPNHARSCLLAPHLEQQRLEAAQVLLAQLWRICRRGRLLLALLCLLLSLAALLACTCTRLPCSGLPQVHGLSSDEEKEVDFFRVLQSAAAGMSAAVDSVTLQPLAAIWLAWPGSPPAVHAGSTQTHPGGRRPAAAMQGIGVGHATELHPCKPLTNLAKCLLPLRLL